MAILDFRPLRPDDLPLLAHWLGRDHVQRWWRDPSAPSQVAEKYLPRVLREEKTEVFLIVRDGIDIGMIQRYRARDHPDWAATLAATGLSFPSAAGIDYLIGEPDLTNRGIGTSAIGAFTDLVFADHADVDCIVVTPQAANEPSCRVLEKNGYTREWTGQLESDDPGDRDTAVLYVRRRGQPRPGGRLSAGAPPKDANRRFR